MGRVLEKKGASGQGAARAALQEQPTHDVRDDGALAPRRPATAEPLSSPRAREREQRRRSRSRNRNRSRSRRRLEAEVADQGLLARDHKLVVGVGLVVVAEQVERACEREDVCRRCGGILYY
jgi:hypothetical protein